MSGRQTPVMKQHSAAKEAYPDAIVFFRLGDFYEMFGEDAVVASRELDLTLTSRNKGKPDEVPMAGVPHHAAHGYVARLLERGHKVAICEQMADPSKVKGIVPRQVVRVITPGTVTEQNQLESDTNNWLCAVEVGLDAVGIALLDLSTGQLRTARLADLAALLSELSHALPRELLLGFAQSARDEEFEAEAATAVESTLSRVCVRADGPVAWGEAPAIFGDLEADAARLPEVARAAVYRVLRFVRACHPDRDLPIRRLSEWDPTRSMVIDPVAQSHLELLTSLSGNPNATLLKVIDETCTPAGARLLRRRLLAPLLEVDRIRRRLDQTETFVVHSRVRSAFRNELSGVNDIQRLIVRACLGEATPRDLGALRDGLAAAGRAVAVLREHDSAELADVLGLDDPVDCVADLTELYDRALVERPPAVPKEGGIFKPGFHGKLDELDSLRKAGTERIVEYEGKIKRETSIPNLKVRFTRVFGWYVEVSRSQSAKAPGDWRRKQTVAAGERYTTDELDRLAAEIETADERHRELELELLAELIDEAKRCAERVRELALRLGRWDVAAALAEVAHRYDYCRPGVDEGTELFVEEGRHPVVERLAAAGRFVPNDVQLDLSEERLWLITGPNMAGKSTLLRQVALTTILAQMGSYVPAKSAKIGVADRVLSRVGASDNLAGGESTFMVEMRETAQILRRATPRSLVILDEIGRGTSTFDGLAIAWAVAEYLDEVVACRALFATHYHELTRLGDERRHVANYSVSAKEMGRDIVFLHRLTKGAASRSYGVFVARLAGLPEAVLARAESLLEALESDSVPRGKATRQSPVNQQLDLFRGGGSEQEAGEIAKTLRALDTDRLTGVEALTLLAQWQKELASAGPRRRGKKKE